ncbi:MAG: SDR family oxidoreductase [Bacteroidales bacterium]|nr:SDR family oxidoreductase [Bacteroidales bacterium]MCF8332594.1 SDR family oxidoreductase [Bacteroidales bacterium]
MSDKKILITGATDGIGKETARRLAMDNHEIIIHGRNSNRVQSAVSTIKQESGNENVFGEVADFTSLKEVKRLSLKLKSSYDALDVLLNNAAIINQDYETTVDGFEKTFQVNYLAPFVLTNNVLTLLKGAVQGRIVNIASMVHSNNINLDDLQLKQNYSGLEAYSATKLYNILFTFKMARLLVGSTITCNCFHPGVINTKLLRNNFGSIGGATSEGADNSVYLAADAAVSNISGKYFRNSRVASPAQIAEDKKVQDTLWNKTLSWVGNYLEDYS